LNHKLIIILFIAIALIVGLIAISAFKPHQEQEPIKLAISFWAGDSHAFLAQELDIFKKNGVDVQLIYLKDYPDTMTAYQNQEVDGIFGTITDAIYYDTTLHPSRVVYITDYSDTADVIVGNIKSLDEIKGKTISVENINSYSHIFVLAALEKYGLTENDVFFEQIPADQVTNALIDGTIDAGHTWEPTTTDALNHGYNVVFSAGRISGIITSAVIINENILEERSDDVKNIVKSLVEAQEYRDLHREKALEIMSRSQNVTTLDLAMGFEGIHTLDLAGNYNAFYNSTEIRESFDFISDFYLKRGQISKIPKFDEIMEGRFIKELANEK
jgi:NitT/TauT family transport system substrate-binding protein